MLAKLGDTEIYFDVDGAGLVIDGSRMREKRPAFLVHGGPGGDHTDGKSSCGPLAAQLQLVYFDHRGQGRSARGDASKYTLDRNVEDMEALRLHLGLGSIVSIGNSYGGMVAMAHAARFPESVSHLILVATAAHSGFIENARRNAAARGTSAQVDASEDLWAGKLDTAEKLRRYYEIMGPLYSVTHDPAKAKLSLDRRGYFPEALNRAFAPGGFLRDFDLRPELSRIKAPALILAGRHDWICAPEFSEEIQKCISGSQLQIFEGSGHSIRADEPERFRSAVLAFVASRDDERLSLTGG